MTSSGARARTIDAECGTAIDCMPSCTVPMFSKIDVTSQLTQPAAVTVCHASGNAVATTARVDRCLAPQSVSPIAAVLTSSSAFSTVRQVWNRVIIAQMRTHGAVVPVHRFADVRVLVAHAAEQLHRQDVRVAVDDAAHDERAPFGAHARELAQPRHEVPQGSARSRRTT